MRNDGMGSYWEGLGGEESACEIVERFGIRGNLERRNCSSPVQHTLCRTPGAILETGRVNLLKAPSITRYAFGKFSSGNIRSCTDVVLFSFAVMLPIQA